MAFTEQDIGGFYKKHLGRDVRPGEAQGWLGNEQAEQMISGSGEAQQYQKTGQAGPAWSGEPGKQYTPAEIGAHALKGMQIGPNEYNREALSQAFMQKQFDPNSNIGNLGDFLKSLGGVAQGVTQLSPDKIRLPDGEVVDVIRDVSAGGSGQSWWGSDKDWEAGRIGGNRGGGGGGGTPQTGGGFQGGPPAGVQQELYDLLLGRARQGLDIDRNSAMVRQQVDPFTAQQERSRRAYMADTAERMGPLANIQGESRLASERAGQASGQFESQLIGREIQSRRDEIRHALDTLSGRLTDDQRIALERELGHLDDATRRYGIGSQSDIARGQLGLGYNQLNWNMDPRNPGNLPRPY